MINELFADTMVISHHEKLFTAEIAGRDSFPTTAG